MKNYKDSQTLLVPHDFTPVADHAIAYANGLAKVLNKPVTLTHIVKSDKEKSAAEHDLNIIAERNRNQAHVDTKTVVVSGNYLKKIGEVAEIVQASLVVMGTHGVKGVQKLIGSYALKVITSSDVPYVVVQSSPQGPVAIRNIVVPLDFSKEAKQKLNHVVNIAQLFQSKVHLVADYESDEFSAKAVENNIRFARGFLKDYYIDFDLIELQEGNTGLQKETLSLAERIQADMLVVMTSHDSKLSEFVMGSSEQVLITNEAHIPVLCINPVNTSVGPHGMSIAHGG
jgi:nucleotide-binding universal stress UspA family protein